MKKSSFKVTVRLTLLSGVSSVALFFMPTTVFAESPSSSRGDWYTSVFVGAGGLNNVETDLDDSAYDVSFDNGFVFGGTVGKYFNDNLRGELELSYAQYGVSSFTRTLGNLSGSGPASGDLSATYLLANLWYDIPTQSKFTPYVGGGVGVGYATANTNFADNSWGYGSGEAGFAFQVGVGLTYALNDQSALDVGYRYRGINGIDFDDSDGSGAYTGGDVRSGSVQVGLRYAF